MRDVAVLEAEHVPVQARDVAILLEPALEQIIDQRRVARELEQHAAERRR